MFLKFEHYDLAISKVSCYKFLKGLYLIILLKDSIVEFKKKNSINQIE